MEQMKHDYVDSSAHQGTAGRTIMWVVSYISPQRDATTTVLTMGVTAPLLSHMIAQSHSHGCGGLYMS
jgi:multisubunit Na+/H+ antiporter MnhG subunit